MMFPQKADQLREEQSLIAIFRMYLMILMFIYLVGAMLEFVVDFQTSSVLHFVFLVSIPIILLTLSFLGVPHRILLVSNMLCIFLINGVQIYLNPKAYHVLVYWTGVMPLIVTVLTQRVRETIFWSILLVIFILLSGLYVSKVTGAYSITIYPERFIAGGFLFLLLTCSVAAFFSYVQTKKKNELTNRNEELASLKAEVEHQRDQLNLKNRRLESYIKSIMELSQSKEVVNGEFDLAVQRVCKTLDYMMKVTQVSYWTYEDAPNTISCRYTFPENKSRNTVHDLANFPRYATRLKMKTILQTSNAPEDPNTSEFCKTYLHKQKIRSMMDAPIVINGKLVGIICCEDTSERNWNGEDLLFASAACDILTISFKAMQNKTYITEIESKHVTLEDQAEEINQMNDKLLLANETLEERVIDRTKELETQNKLLSEYAFINSHLLRAPLSSILGLINLLHNSDLSKKERELVQHLHASGMKLDEIIHRISETLGKGNHINRHDIALKDPFDEKPNRRMM
jgi:hypothetical protein